MLSTGGRLPIADPSMRELGGSTLTGIGAKKLKSLITPENGKLILGGLIKRRTRTSISGIRGNGALPCSEETGSALEEPRAEAGWGPDKAGVAPKRST
jgi:hypothetical protein